MATKIIFYLIKTIKNSNFILKTSKLIPDLKYMFTLKYMDVWRFCGPLYVAMTTYKVSPDVVMASV